MRLLLALALIAATAGTAAAGADNVDLSCKARSKKSKAVLTGDIPGDFATWSLDSGDAGWSDKDSILAVVEETANKVFTLVVLDEHHDVQLQLVAIPATVKRTETKDDIMWDARFDAWLITDRRVKMRCTLHYDV